MSESSIKGVKQADQSIDGHSPAKPPRPPSVERERISLEKRQTTPTLTEYCGRSHIRSLSFDRAPLPTPPGPMTLSCGPGSRGVRPQSFEEIHPKVNAQDQLLDRGQPHGRNLLGELI